MAIDIYTPAVMIPYLREKKPVRTFLQDRFFPEERTYRTETIAIDRQIRGRRVAAFRDKYSPAKVVDRQGFTTDSVAPPCLALKIPISVEDISTRVMGEHPFENRDPAQRGMLLLADDLTTLQEMITRRKEMMCRDAIYTLNGDASIIRARGEDYSADFEFPRLPAMQLGTLGGTDAWSHASSDPIAQFETWLEAYAQATGLSATDILLGSAAYKAFRANVKVAAQLQTWSLLNNAVAVATDVPNGVRQVGHLYGGAVRIWTYNEWYDDPDNAGATTPMVPPKSMMLASDQLRTERRYGAVRDLSDLTQNAMPVLVETTMLPRSWIEIEQATRWLELRSRPLPVPIQNHFMTAQVVA